MDLLREKLCLTPMGARLYIVSNKAPDTSRSDAVAADMMAETKRMNEWMQTLYANDLKPAADEAAATSRAVSEAQLKAMEQATDQAADYAQYEKTVFRPLEKSIVQDAVSFDTEAERERLAGLAAADVQQAAAGARATTNRVAASMGINPADGLWAATNAGAERDTTLAMADAKNKARQQATTMGRALKLDAASLGRGLPAANATQAGLAQGSGQVAASAGMQPLAAASQAAGVRQGGWNAAMNGMAGAGNIFQGNERLKTQAGDNSALLGAAGRVGGSILSGGSGSIAAKLFGL